MSSPFTNITKDAAGNARRDITRLLDAHAEWFCTEETTAHQTSNHHLRRVDCDVNVERHQLIFSFWGAQGFTAHSVRAWSYDDNQIKFQIAILDTVTPASLVTLTPRASITDDAARLEHARLELCARLAHLAINALDETAWKIETCALSPSTRRTRPGRFARVILARGRSRIALTCDLTNIATPTNARKTAMRPATDSLLASSLLWLARLAASRPAASRKHGRIKRARSAIDNTPASTQLWIVASGAHASDIALRCACLRPTTRACVRVYGANDDLTALTDEPTPSLDEAVRTSRHTASRLTCLTHHPSQLAERIRLLAPEAIDIIPARHGETLRFHGLAFARLRRLMNREHLWLGVSHNTRTRAKRDYFRLAINDTDTSDISDTNTSDTDAGDTNATAHTWRTVSPIIGELIAKLVAARRHDSSNHRHTLFHLAPESWLESLLRRDITRLDAGLRLAPLHAQIRTAHTASHARPVDLLAVRRDGRLVVIELKVAEDDALPFQAADYWRRIETLRQAHGLDSLFETVRLADAPPLVYAVAPLLRFARSFDSLAALISPRIELYRFDINEDWRAGVRVMRRARVGSA
ncbi:MAG: hypothetical protein MSG64_08500 [Pyrinomonadaceae bacterium MAG19_C2-C3]|nr:hypothetical protein [Pyrinomonadaceae bacterium MAG19_C2-C3]